MSKARRIGLSWEPPPGWPLDALLVGPAVVRTLRELCPGDLRAYRAWDLALRTGVTPQGTTKALLRLERAEIVYRCRADAGSAARFALDREHPLVAPLGRLFEVERASVRSAWPDRARP